MVGKEVDTLGDFADLCSVWSEKERSDRIRKENCRLRKIFKNIPEDKFKTIEKLIVDAAFLAVTLEETRLMISRDGIIEEYQNGANQSGKKKSSAVEVYDKFLNTYIKVIKQLCDCLPEDENINPAEEIMSFVTGVRN